MPLVSIEIPHHNRPRLLLKTVESCLTQTYSDYEILIYDDGSNPTAELLDTFDKLSHIRQLKIHRSETQGGVSRARNTLWGMSSSPYHCFIDSDDLMHPMRISDQMELLLSADISRAKNQLGCNRFVCSTDYRLFSLEDNRARESVKLRLTPGEIKDEFFYRQPIAFGGSLVYDISGILAPFDEHLIAAEDYTFFASSLLNTHFMHLAKIRTYVSINPNGLSSLATSRRFQLQQHARVIHKLWHPYIPIDFEKAYIIMEILLFGQSKSSTMSALVILNDLLDLSNNAFKSLPSGMQKLVPKVLHRIRSSLR